MQARRQRAHAHKEHVTEGFGYIMAIENTCASLILIMAVTVAS